MRSPRAFRTRCLWRVRVRQSYKRARVHRRRERLGKSIVRRPPGSTARVPRVQVRRVYGGGALCRPVRASVRVTRRPAAALRAGARARDRPAPSAPQPLPTKHTPHAHRINIRTRAPEPFPGGGGGGVVPFDID